MHFTFFFLPLWSSSILFWLYFFFLYFLLCVAEMGRWLEMKVEVKRQGGGITDRI